MAGTLPPETVTLAHIAALLRDDALDAAIEAGLMAAWPDVALAALDAGDRARIVDARHRLREAWAARARYRQRNARLERRAGERAAARTPSPVAADAADAPRPTLPSTAAALLARARARAAGRES
ncbi:hypothetical protein [Luteimonas deserti]|uniref:Uncharacterized protein n=1 Tax=Luteimonas deserti TaxID=2752306 RepID=A0A7Z0QV29_9GAMM|nr:hypothetical protein [Luteimonas deserti]NYZ63918.1 hypothetical protein [Luteimonas deserti]